MNYGIVIVALGYPLYGNCAFNLALSIKHLSPDVPIAIVHEDHAISELTEKELSYFDHFVKLPEKFYTVDGKKQYQRAKLCLDLIAKTLNWERVMYMDADNLWLDRPVEWLFGELMNKDFHIGYNGQYDVVKHKYTNRNYTYWASISEKHICNYHGIKILPQTVSGFVYFRMNEKTTSIFKKSREVYDDPKAPTITWSGGKPDEYCMNVALAHHGYTQADAHIFYFDKVNGNLANTLVEKTFWGIAIGGNKVIDRLVHWYNRKVNTLCEINKIPTRHYHQDKKDVISERKLY